MDPPSLLKLSLIVQRFAPEYFDAGGTCMISRSTGGSVRGISPHRLSRGMEYRGELLITWLSVFVSLFVETSFRTSLTSGIYVAVFRRPRHSRQLNLPAPPCGRAKTAT